RSLGNIWLGSGLGLGAAEGFFYLAPHLLDGVEVRGVRRQKEDLSTGLLNEREGQLILVRGEIVHDHQVCSSKQIPSITLRAASRLRFKDRPLGDSNSSYKNLNEYA